MMGYGKISKDLERFIGHGRSENIMGSAKEFIILHLNLLESSSTLSMGKITPILWAFNIKMHISNCNQKSVNFQYDMLGCLDYWTNELSTKCLMFPKMFFFHDFQQNSLQKSFQFILLFFYKITKIKIKSFQCPKTIRNYKR